MEARRLGSRSLRVKFALLLAGITLCVGVNVFLVYRTSSGIRGRLEELRESFPEYAYADQIDHRVDGLFALYDTYLATGQTAFLDDFRNETNEVITLSERLSSNLPLSERARVARFRVQLDRYVARASALAAALGEGRGKSLNPFRDEATSALYEEVSRLRGPLEESTTTLLQNRRDFLDRYTYVIVARIDRQIRSSLIWAFATSILAAWVLAVLAGRIIRPIVSLSARAEAIAQGNLDPSDLPIRDSADEVGTLARAFRTMVDGLRATTVSRDYVDDIVQSMADTLAVVDGDGRIRMVNRALEELLGYEGGELIGRPLGDVLERTGEAGIDRSPPAELSPEGCAGQERTYLTREGKRIPMLLSAAPLRTAEGGGGHVCVARDISDRIEARRIMEELMARAEAASVAKGSFLASMSHEIRTPLNGILGMSDLLRDTPLSPEQRTYVGSIVSSSQALLTVVNDVLDLSRIEADRLELEATRFDVREVLEGALEIVAPRGWEKGIELTLVVDPEIPPALVGDAGRLRQVLINLLTNAIRFTDRGEVGLRARLEEAGEDAEDSVTVRFDVRDTGTGIPPEKLDLIFEPFRQAAGARDGSGLGLAISRRLAGLLGGRIWVESEPGRGSTFHVTARLRRVPDAAAELSPGRPGRAPLAGARIAAVDDNASSRENLAGLLRSWGAEADVIESGFGLIPLLTAARDDGRPYRAVIIDADVRGVSAAAIAREIGRIDDLPPLKLVVLDLRGGRGRERWKGAGFHAVHSKPFRGAALLETLRVLLHGGGVAAAPADEPPRAAALPAGANGPGPRVLVAEDNEINQTVTRALLEKQGCRVTVVATGTDAVAAFERGGFDLILMDVEMPEMSGLDAAARIRDAERDRGGHVPIAAMTAHAVSGDRERCLAAGMDDYLSKPVRADRLRETVARLATGEGARFDEDAARAYAGGDEALLREVVDAFLDAVPALLAGLRSGVASADRGAVGAAAHRIKGMAATLGGVRAAAAAKRLEDASSKPALPLDGAGDELAREMSALADHLRERFLGRAA